MAFEGEEPTDETLVARVATGDRTAFAFLVKRHGLRYRALAFRYLDDVARAEDLAQEAFVKLWTHAGRFDAGKAKFTTWFHRIVVNRCLDDKRRKKADPLPEGFDEADNRPGAEEKLAQEGGKARLRTALAALSDRQKIAVTLSYFDGLSNMEAAAAMDMNLKAYESLLVRSRAKLREQLQAEKQQLFEALG
ncbi:sigma-70 family RNA polymerase sigma factor [Kordiimonas aestuarii]|uniref:sigma-70 family RNA polymerase sigma factor n=1 Tax=Kordiimonas aestuarii TaxID=1005925 RepID=UPI0021D3298C|nr:sigma-70 family RNA polymerase sigma factor [Kordiimonas aestuarii]